MSAVVDVPKSVASMNRNKQVELQIRTATLKSRVHKLEVVGSMRTRVTGPMKTPVLLSQMTQHVCITDKNHLVMDSGAGMKSETTVGGKTLLSAADRDPEAVDDDSDSDDGDCAWPGGLPTCCIADVLEEAKRISQAAC